jgi:hypothetical protein
MLGYAKSGVMLAGLVAFWPDAPVDVVEVNVDGSYLGPWDKAADTPPCAYWNTSVRYKTALCNHFALARMSPATAQEALSRALECASAHDTDCILSSEVAFSIPTAFVYDQVSGLQMLVAPKIIQLPENTTFEERDVAFQDPRDSSKKTQLTMNNTIHVEYYDPLNKEIQRKLFRGQDSYCVQIARVAFDDSCWKNLD